MSIPHHAIPFTLMDHLTACLCIPPLPFFKNRTRARSSSTSSSLASSDDFPQDARHSLLQHYSPHHLDHDRDDDAAWGSDALSLRSRGGTSSRRPNNRALGTNWLWGLFAGRRRAMEDDAMERVLFEGYEDDLREEQDVREERGTETAVVGDGAVKEDEVVAAPAQLSLEDQHADWGQFQSAPAQDEVPASDFPLTTPISPTDEESPSPTPSPSLHLPITLPQSRSPSPSLSPVIEPSPSLLLSPVLQPPASPLSSPPHQASVPSSTSDSIPLTDPYLPGHFFTASTSTPSSRPASPPRPLLEDEADFGSEYASRRPRPRTYPSSSSIDSSRRGLYMRSDSTGGGSRAGNTTVSTSGSIDEAPAKL